MIDIITSRLYLRKFALEDAEAMFLTWANDPEVTKYMTWNPHGDVSLTKQIISMWVNEYNDEKTYKWAICLKETGQLIGSIDVVEYVDGCPVIGYCLGREFWNKGYMSEAAQSVLDYLRFEGFKHILIEAMPENIGSNRVIQKLGFKSTGTKTKYVSLKDKYVVVNTYEINFD